MFSVNTQTDIENRIFKKEKDVGNGAWVLVKCKIPVSKEIAPQTYGIYWAIPKDDNYERQKVAVYTPTEVCLLNHEYSIITEEKLKIYIEEGYYLVDNKTKVRQPLNQALIQQGRELCEEEKDIIRALMLDGLTEKQACEEYFFTHHIDDEKIGLCYLPTEEMLKAFIDLFGESGVAG